MMHPSGRVGPAKPAAQRENVFAKRPGQKPHYLGQGRRPWEWGLTEVLNNEVRKIGANLSDGAILPGWVDPIGEKNHEKV